MKLGEAMYKAQQEQAGGPAAGESGTEGASAQSDEEVVDAEFSEVDEESKG
jgi:molecular chaperone DnaK